MTLVTSIHQPSLPSDSSLGIWRIYQFRSRSEPASLCWKGAYEDTPSRSPFDCKSRKSFYQRGGDSWPSFSKLSLGGVGIHTLGFDNQSLVRMTSHWDCWVSNLGTSRASGTARAS